MTWLASQLNIPSELIESWVQLGLLLAICALVLGRRRAAAAFLILAFVPMLLPMFRPLFDEFKENLLTFVPWYVILIVAFFFVFIVLRSVIGLFMGPEIATRTTADLLTVTIAGIFATIIGAIRFVITLLLGLLGR